MKKILTAVITIPLSLTAMAQSVTANHDATKMNQITVQETGVGSLTPPLYYQLTHNRYKRTAQLQNKMTFRTSVGINAYNQIELAEKFDSAMIHRAKIEALNIADRQVDLAWKTEQKKIEDKLSDFQRNINRIMVVGGNNGQVNLWRMEYQKFQTAIKAIKEAYMPNAQRKKQYLRIYRDIRDANENLVKFLVYLNSNQLTGKLLAARYTKPDNVDLISKSAMNRWRTCAWKVTPNGNKPGGGIIIGPIKPPFPWIKPEFPDRPIIPDRPIVGPVRPPNRPPLQVDTTIQLPIDPIKPIEPADTLELIKPDNPFNPSGPLKPTEPKDTLELVKPDFPDRPIIGPTKPIDPISPVQPNPKPIGPTDPLQPIKPLPGGAIDQLKPMPDNGMIMRSMVRSGRISRIRSTSFNTINNKTKS